MEVLAPLEINLLGGFHVNVGSQRLPDSVWRLSKSRNLLKLLALAPGHRLPRDRVLDLLWPDLAPDAAANNLYQALHVLRRALRSERGAVEVRSRQGLLMLQPDGPLTIDVETFEAAAASARRSDEPPLYHAAIALYRGDLLPDDQYEDWAVERREMLRDTYMGLLLDVARRHEARGELRGAMDALRRVVQKEPAHEQAHMEMVRLYASTGQRGRALRQYRHLQEVLAADLDVEPDESSRKLYSAILAGRFADAQPPPDDLPAPRHNLPIALTSFIGRGPEVSRMKELVSTSRLVTLTGVGGTGKTRLALRVGWELLGAYPDGVWLVNLSFLTNPELVPKTVANALQIAEQPGCDMIDAICDHLREHRTLLILDNCEHLRAACARLVTRLLTVCADLQIVATSRVRLGVPGEIVVVVEPLSIPGPGVRTIDELAQFEAVQLFRERARFRQSRFSLTPSNWSDVARICRQLEGIPLAVELAAARVGMLSVAQIADHLTDAPGFLAGDDLNERHRTLRAALDWSYRLLDDDERRLFRRLSVFEGGWLLDGAKAIDESGDQAQTLDRLSNLVDKSLVSASGAAGDVVRYRLLEPVRQYAAELLGAEEAVVAHQRHAELYAALSETAEEELRGPASRPWLDRLEAEHDNLRAALRWCIEQREIELGLRVAGAIWRFWFQRSHLKEGRSVMGQLLALSLQCGSVSPAVQAKAFNAAGAMAFYQTDHDEATKNYEACLALRREIGDEDNIGKVLSNLGLVLKDRGEHERAGQLFEESLTIAKRSGNKRSMASTLGNLGILAQERGDYDRARVLQEESLALDREVGARAGVTTSLNNLGAIAVERGQYEQARSLLMESLSLARELGVTRSASVALINLGHVARKQEAIPEALEHYREGLLLAREQGERALMATSLEGLAASFVRRGQAARAATLFSAAESLRLRSGTPRVTTEAEEYESILDTARRQLGSDFEPAWAMGRSTSIDGIVALVLEELSAEA